MSIQTASKKSVIIYDYSKNVRNKLSHKEAVLWLSNTIDKIVKSIPEKVIYHYDTKNWKTELFDNPEIKQWQKEWLGDE
ncbi:MAG: hypothetical protein GY756_09920 [bacterium]|nr:hypothetical protein [bacterium]